MPDAPYSPAVVLAALPEATEQLLRTASKLGPVSAAEPSALPGWTRGHVLTHLARNADALVNLLTAARTRTDVPAYASAEARELDIEKGAGRPLEEQLADLAHAAERFAEQAAAMPAEAWPRRVRHRSGRTVPAAEIPWMRLAEIEYHHVDLAAGYTPAHWSAAFVRRELGRLTTRFRGDAALPAVALRVEDSEMSYRIGAETDRAAAGTQETTVVGPAAALVAWLSGRADGDGLQVHLGGTQLADPRGTLPQPPPMS